MASLSPEEENYVRMSLLLTGISQRASRKYFDYEFDPACLQTSLRKNNNKLFELKKKNRINVMQWNLLFPSSPNVPDSKTFDISLMITLLRNLTKIGHPSGGFDCLPNSMETSSFADLARLKYYRNYLAHLGDANVGNTEFNNAWDNISGAIYRLGGQDIKQQNNEELKKKIKISNDEIKEIRESNDALHKELATLLTDLEIHKKNDTVPWNIREKINDKLKTWKDNDDKMFIETKAAQYVLESIQEHHCVTITACSGVGKTATLRHVALKMANEYDVLIVTQPADIVNFNNPKKKTLFVVDDICGNFSVEQKHITNWEPFLTDIQQILEKNETKILAACRLQVYQDEKFASLSVFKTFECNLLLENICLSKTEKKMIAELYIGKEASVITDLYDVYDCFPLLCKLYHDNPKPDITDFFQNPFTVFEYEINQLLTRGYYTKYCALALSVVFNNELRDNLLTEEVNEETRIAIENTCEACKLDRGTSRLVLQDELESLKGTYIKQEENVYRSKHDKIFDFLAFFYAKEMITCLIKNADAGLIKERFLLEREDGMDEFITIIPPQHHSMYINRMINDWGKGNLQDVFGNVNMKNLVFRQTFMSHLNKLDISYQRDLANIWDNQKNHVFTHNDDYAIFSIQTEKGYKRVTTRIKFYNTVLINCCLIGDLSMVEWCLKNDIDINKCSDFGQSPVMLACEKGHTKVVMMLIDNGADCTTCDGSGQSALMLACEHGHTEISKILLDRGVDCNVRDISDNSPIMKACKLGYAEIVKMLLNRGADCSACDWRGHSSVMMACKNGHTKILKMLLNREVDCNAMDKWGESPLYMACKRGHSEIVRILLESGVSCNSDGSHFFVDSPILTACKYGHTKIAKMLLESKANCIQNRPVTDFLPYEINQRCLDSSLLLAACEGGHVEIVKMLLDQKTDRIIYPDFHELDKRLREALKAACAQRHIEIVKMLLDKLSKPTRHMLCKQKILQ